MTDATAYADLYLNFEDRQQWLQERLTRFSFSEYRAFVDYVFEQLDPAFEAGQSAEFVRVKGLLLAIARKKFEVAHFMAGLTGEQRETCQRTAQAYFELARGFYPDNVKPAVDAAWAESQDHAARFGAVSAPAVFEILRREQCEVFRR